ncbi:21340_t:CDS:2 [Dentiscutata erythropus]|uniref:21340_t:CDS:1 n=1 Tax=Dentiscutata erythropus TaxID=1348616 RepID=A0A9N8WL18_9GLOM|nr:21340_t:CDS:2 [Dentiscutata erythropus]
MGHSGSAAWLIITLSPPLIPCLFQPFLDIFDDFKEPGLFGILLTSYSDSPFTIVVGGGHLPSGYIIGSEEFK